MLDQFVKAIQAKHGLQPLTVKIHGVDRLLIPQADGGFYLQELDEPAHLPSALAVATLSAVVDYVKAPDRGLEDAPLIVHVRSANEVAVVSRLLDNDFAQRETLLVATVPDLVDVEVDDEDDEEGPFTLGQYRTHEVFIVALQSLFADSPMRKPLLDLVGGIRGEHVHESADDGYAQSVTVRQGVHLVKQEGARIENPVTLAPYRTFREIAQPGAPFIVRAKSNPGGERPLLALFEADGGGWRVQAVAAIKAFLTDQLKGVEGVTILA